MLLMNVDRRLISRISICNHRRLMQLSLVPILADRQRELILAVLLKHIYLRRVEKLDALLSVAKKHILSINDNFCTSI